MSTFAALGQIVSGVTDSPSDGAGPVGEEMNMAQGGGPVYHARGPGVTRAALTALGSSHLRFTITCNLGLQPQTGRTQLGTPGWLPLCYTTACGLDGQE